ncbi:NB-ARC domain-containing protein [Corchorus capsularis]|uniref:NB-ARC domain-containing protein n=1 Tax=Corchorus capsularis TaxID=210143 RepID=A0A1R3JM27_COCAP|nr:NB-ARC domain-containing protein [Corchorus capsularis]
MELADLESLELFSRHDFETNHPPHGFFMLSNWMVNYAKGIPLALKVLGSALQKHPSRYWERVKRKLLKQVSYTNIENVLKSSFEGLDAEQKSIFVDITCFFNRDDRNHIEEILAPTYLSIENGIEDLINKSLITHSDKRLKMHDLLQEMGRNIVRNEFVKPGKRSRLWTPEDVYHVLINNSPSYLYWEEYPSRYLPSNFNPKKLVEFSMPRSNLEEFLDGSMDLVNLKKINLSYSKISHTINIFPGTPWLRELDLSGTPIQEIPISVGCLHKLVDLSLNHCTVLNKLPSSIYLRSFPKILEKMESLQVLSLEETGIRSIPWPVTNLINLKYLGLRGVQSIQRSSVLNAIQKSFRVNSAARDCSDALNAFVKVSLRDCPALTRCVDKYEALSPNFYQWERAMQMALLSKNKLDFVDGTIPVPASTAPLFLAWKRCNNLVISWLVHSVSASIAQSILWLDSAPAIWKDLKARFGQTNSLCICDLQTEIHSCVQGSLTVHDYFTKLKILWDEFQLLRPIPSCACQPICSCGLSKIREYFDNDQVMVFIKGLNESYSTVKSQILLMDPLPTLNKDARSEIVVNAHRTIQLIAAATSVEILLLFPSRKSLKGAKALFSFPTTEIPAWFSYQSIGSSVSVQLPPGWQNSQFLGFEFCVVVESPEEYVSDHRYTELFCVMGKRLLSSYKVHFWAPTFKWCINIANLVDISTRPAETVSCPQQAALACSGLIWARYSTVITPKNWNLFSVSIAMVATASYQLSRKLQHEFSTTKSTVAKEY